MRKYLAGLFFALSLMPALAQVPPPVPALPDTERRTSYSISGTTCACSVGFALYGDSTDYANWLTVWINGVQIAQPGNWTITSPTGSLSTIPRPITDAILTFTAPQTGTVQIVGARRPRRPNQFSENRGVAARDLNQVLTDMVAMERERWDLVQSRIIQGLPGETIGPLPSATARAGGLLAFDGSGNPTTVTPGVGTGNVIGPGLSVNNDVACWNGTTGALLKDCGAIGTTTLTGDVTGGPSVGTVATTLANTAVTPTTYGSTSQAPQITVDSKGRITAASNQTITPASISAVPTTRQVSGGTGMTAGGTLASDVTLGLANIPSNTIIANNNVGSAAPSDLSLSQVLDMAGTTQGSILYRNATTWVPLTPGTNGQLLTSGGAAANPSWTTASGTGTVTSVAAGTGITASPSPIVGAGTISITAPVTAALGGSGVVSPTAHTVQVAQGASAFVGVGPGTTGQCLVANSAADPTYVGGCKVLLNTLTASNSATLSDTTSFTSAYKEYELVFTNLIPATASVTLELQVHASAAFQTTSYISAGLVTTSGGSTDASLTATTFVQLSESGSVNNVAPGASAHIHVYNPTSGATPTVFNGVINHARSGFFVNGYSGGYWNSSTAVDGFRVLFSSGNITSGTIKVYGIL